MKKLAAILAILALTLGLLAGCGSGTQVEYYDTGADAEPTEAADTAEAPAETEAPAAGIAIGLGGTGYETYAPDTVVGTVNGEDVTWMEYYYWLSYETNYYLTLAQQYEVPLTSWDAAGELSSDMTNADALIDISQFMVRQYHAVWMGLTEAGVALTEEDQAALQDVYVQSADTDGNGQLSEEEIAAFDEYLAEQNADYDFFMYLNGLSALSDAGFVQLFGKYGEKTSDEITEQFIADSGALNAKHILLLTVDENTREPLDEDTIAQKRETAETLQAELAAVADDKEALIALFDEYMNTYSEDTGLEAYPDGYVFGEGEMVPEFEEGVKALDEDYGLSEVVESEYGFHIILRQPLTPDTVMGTDSETGTEVTMRYYAAQQQYQAMIGAWTDSAEVVWFDGFEKPDMAAIFG